MDDFREANILSKYLAAEQQIAAREAVKGTVLMPRDIMVMSLYGRLFQFKFPDGRKVSSMAARADVSDSIDVLAQTPGDLLVRGPQFWEPISAGAPGDVLTSQGPGLTPVWAPASGGGFPWNPPALATFTIWVNQINASIASSPAGPLVFSQPDRHASLQVQCIMQALATPPRSYILGFLPSLPNENGVSAGMWLRDSASGRLVRWNIRGGTVLPTMSLSVDYYSSTTSFDSNVRRIGFNHFGPVWFRVDDDGADFTFSVSTDRTQWLPFTTTARTAWLANPDQIGIGVITDGSPSIGVQLAAWDWITQ